MTNWFDRLFKKPKDKSESKSETPAAPEVPCDHSSSELKPDTAEYEYHFAKLEIEGNGDLAHGARHLERLLTYDPGNSEWMALLDRYIAAVPDLEALIPQVEPLYYGREAMRCYLWYKQGRLVPAVNLLTGICCTRPKSGYQDAWVLPWLEEPGALEQMPAASAAELFDVVQGRHPAANLITADQLLYLGRWVQLLDRHLAAHPEGLERITNSGLYCKAGMYDKAVHIGKSALASEANWFHATALALIMMKKGSPREADEYFQKSLTFDPSDHEDWLEYAEAYFTDDDWQTALSWYEAVLEKDAKQTRAAQSAKICRHILESNQAARDAGYTLPIDNYL